MDIAIETPRTLDGFFGASAGGSGSSLRAYVPVINTQANDSRLKIVDNDDRKFNSNK